MTGKLHQKVPLMVRLPKGVHKRLMQYSSRNAVSLNAAIIDIVKSATAPQTVTERAAEILAEALVRKVAEKAALTPESLEETVRKLQHNQVVLEKMFARILPQNRLSECHDQSH